ncbi:hypothetical protein KXJ69_00935 [Aureisphaera sp. CAU 1614]|uniref:Uncharacterized protein n=1 Tax=Halomarinibacterium sedimenti TaxID=2857106 RepID=A0A9X1JUB1_9FLAO|nr:DUF6695 family protein [Halomarinibacterium sedimenti]MBW2936649.1 hypothetical protein [Halomarinibacterium sedimenti]
MKTTGKIVVLAYPDTFVKMSDEWICKFLPLVGLGTKDYIKAGHAAQILINTENGEAYYYDFGRYITPNGFGRVRSAKTDAELEIPFAIEFDAHQKIVNLDQLLLWLEANPQKTHGEGRLLASVCEPIDFEKAKSYADSLQNMGSIPYGAFDKKGSNCARFVTETILAGTSEKRIQKALAFNKKFTPSGIGNVEKAGLGKVFEVLNGIVKPFEGSAFKENLKNYFHKKKSTEAERATFFKVHENLQKLEGIGSSAYFEVLDEKTLPENHFRIKRYNELLQEDFDGVYYSEDFDINKPFQFTYDSHCAFCHVLQDDKKMELKVVAKFDTFNS